MNEHNFKEGQLFFRLKKYKDRQAFLEVYNQLVEPIYRFVFFKINNRAEAEDLTSAIFLKLWSFVQDGKLKAEKSLRALTYKIARNTVIDYYRQGRSEVSLADGQEFGDTATTMDKLNQAIDYQLLLKQLASLKEEYREIIILHFVNQLGINEIAEILGKTKGAVRVTLHRALKTLKALLEK